MKHIKIGVDMDEVLCELFLSLTDRFNTINGTFHNVRDIQHYDLEKLYGCTKEELGGLLREFFISKDHTTMVPIVGALEGIEKIKDFDLIIISARPEHTRNKTEEWLHKHFPNIFSDIHLIGDPSGLGGMALSKGEFAKELGIQVFIEDSLTNAKNIASYGIPVLLLDRTWNQGELPPLVTRAFSWEEAVSFIQKMFRK